MKNFLKAVLNVFLTSICSILLIFVLATVVNHLADKYGIDEYSLNDCDTDGQKHGK